MHRTVGIGALDSRPAEVNGTKENCCVQDLRKIKKAETGNIRFRLILFLLEVFCDNFLAVDFREELCYHSRPKKQIRRGDAIDRDVVYFFFGVFSVFKKLQIFEYKSD